MADVATVPAPAPVEKTFRAYTKEQGATYAKGRLGYDQRIYNYIYDHHVSTGGQTDSLLDIGCGPGTVARELSPRFTRTIALDPSVGMIDAARALGGATSAPEPIRFEVSTAEELGSNLSPPVADASVDLITAATAAHWFDMPGFWAAAARVLKPGGSVAIWTSSSKYIHPSMPNATSMQQILQDFRDEYIQPYMTPGNLIAEKMYETLPMPWDLETPVAEFEESAFLRKDWNKDGTVGPDGEFFLGQKQLSLGHVERLLETVSPVTRWREAHPDDVGTDRDVVKMAVGKLASLLHEAGMEPGKEIITTGVTGALIMVKKKE
ncbi:methyltransferase domain-containing protein [Colletotrichum scovillei]|uniref:Methyltransferase domain-containing protein n=1 Tax=Colletotrichum scovillei TaxID=1209932 RepID=A0A9P7R0Z7_9PEZI|nr:methyltransferase domain-containing protein [Colletotrichum scovillei]KAF4784196.1 methyltransferase domain-containing protein [Colletotrichum scovillei]KAG7044781.1 methyltransferase domain-containing protein [Colletotrichum scovillei]KAG7049486.1 methyltransferase domain-containing protein [Colletotrichum scovillei]KAG7064234.1 methyltransferase domain-containing protein [Colletotrichum scovillei]